MQIQFLLYYLIMLTQQLLNITTLRHYHLNEKARCGFSLRYFSTQYQQKYKPDPKIQLAARKQYFKLHSYQKNSDPLFDLKQELLEQDLHPQLIYTREKKKSYQKPPERFGKENSFLKEYKDVFVNSLRPNVVNLNLKIKSAKKQQDQEFMEGNYINKFYKKFGNILRKESPEYHQVLLFDLLEKLNNVENSDQNLEKQLFIVLKNQKAVRFLILFRAEIIQSLEKKNFFSLEPSKCKQQYQANYNSTIQVLTRLGIDKQLLSKQRRLGLKQKQIKMNKRLLPSQYIFDQQVQEIDFIKDNEVKLIKHIPTLNKKDQKDYIYFKIQALPKRMVEEDKLIPVSSLPKWTWKAFQNEKKLNTIQTQVYPKAFFSDQNLLICAPTGSGKTNIAMLAILREIEKHLNEDSIIDQNSLFKIIYISPMKALAGQIVKKFSKKLSHLNVKVRQLTGDMQLSQIQLQQTHIIVVTPEKWDIVTRKSNIISTIVKLVIFDQIHLLNDQRGPVLQSIVARLHRNIERNQELKRLVGLSATLPNFVDVAHFLHIDTSKKEGGIFHFDASYRPVPLVMKFIGVKSGQDQGARMKKKPIDIFNQRCYNMIVQYLKQGKQVLVFVHSRKQTSNYCKYIEQKAKEQNHIKLFFTDRNAIQKIKSNDFLQHLFYKGLGYHHAGMKRQDRNIVEDFFLKGIVKVLVATATLAWGVNLPAFAVIIKGTDIFDPNRGGVQDLNILDVQQMFGRAGRPQFDSKGQAILMTTFKKVGRYMGNLTSTSNIESKFLDHINQAMNAEIAAGTITSQLQAFEWIKYTFFAIRLRRNPSLYRCMSGGTKEQREMNCDMYLRELVEMTIRELDTMKLIRYDHKNFIVQPTELGRITSHYYIRCQTMVHFCQRFHINFSDQNRSNLSFKYKSDLQIFRVVGESKQFENIRVRPEEREELEKLVKSWIFNQNPDFGGTKVGNVTLNINQGPIIQTPEKVILLIQAYLIDYSFQGQAYSLYTDTQYIIQNSIRLLRCLLDLCNKKYQAQNVESILKWCKYIENKMWEFDNPLKQFCKSTYTGFNPHKQFREGKRDYLFQEYYNRLEQYGKDRMIPITQLKEMSIEEISHKLKSNKNVGISLVRFISFIPKVEVNYRIKPVAQTILHFDVQILPQWYFSRQWHYSKEIFWLILDNEQEILHSQTFIITEKNVVKKLPIELSFFIPNRQEDRKIRIAVRSDRWITQMDNQIYIDLHDLGLKNQNPSFTKLLPLHPLPVSVLPQLFQFLYPFKFFNPIQTQVFHLLYHTNQNSLIGAPTGSGKTIMAQFAIIRMLIHMPKSKCVYVAPLKSLVKERLIDWKERFQNKHLGARVVQLTGDYTPDLQALLHCRIILTTPQKWDGITRNYVNRKYIEEVSLIIFDEIHLLGQERGAIIQVIVSRMNRIIQKNKIRMIGLSTAMANSQDVAEWFGCQKGFFNFKPSVRPVPIEIHFDGFTQKQYCARMGTMNKPAFNHIRMFSEGKPVLIFVSSRRQTRLTALDLIAFIASFYIQSPYILCDPFQLKKYLDRVSDQCLNQTLQFGIAMHHAGLNTNDRKICQQLFVKGKVQIMIATSTLAWGVNFPARLVIIKGTEYYDCKKNRFVDMPVTDILQMIGRAGRPQFDSKGVACVYVEQSKKNFYRKYLNDPFPIQSGLLNQLDDHINAQIVSGTITSKQHILQWLSWTYFFRRILKNAVYYGLQNDENQTIKNFFNLTIEQVLVNLEKSGCVVVEGKKIIPTCVGFISSFYYLRHQTAALFNQLLRPDITLIQILKLLSDAFEFNEVPVRHNQDEYNKELYNICPIKIKMSFDCPHAKTFLLFQAYLFNLPVPIRDYSIDMKLVIDNSIRILSGLIDIASEKRFLKTTLNSILFMQMIYQGMWWNDIPYKNVPFFSRNVIEWLQNNQIYVFFKLSKIGQQKFVDKLRNVIKKEFDQQASNISIKALQCIPRLRLQAKIIMLDQPVEDANAYVEIQISKQNNYSQRVEIQKSQKIKQASWYLLIGQQRMDLVLSQKRIFVNKQCIRRIPITTVNIKKITVYLLSDCYLGIDQIKQLTFQ